MKLTLSTPTIALAILGLLPGVLSTPTVSRATNPILTKEQNDYITGLGEDPMLYTKVCHTTGALCTNHQDQCLVAQLEASCHRILGIEVCKCSGQPGSYPSGQVPGLAGYNTVICNTAACYECLHDETKQIRKTTDKTIGEVFKRRVAGC